VTPAKRPTPGELEILAVLWQRGPATVREVHAALAEHRPTGYTTVLKLMQIMADKQLVARDESQRSHVYRACVRRDQIQNELVGDLADRAFAGSAAQLAMRALSSRPVSAGELAELRALLATLDEKRGRKR
jgi:predicted transcriptional regulator